MKNKLLVEELNRFKKLAGVTQVLNEGGEKDLAELLIKRIVGAGEKVFPKEIGEVVAKDGSKAVIKVDYYRSLMSKDILTAEESDVVRTINTRIAKKVGTREISGFVINLTKDLDNAQKLFVTKKFEKLFDKETGEKITNEVFHSVPPKPQPPAPNPVNDFTQEQTNNMINSLKDIHLGQYTMDDVKIIIGDFAKRKKINLKPEELNDVAETLVITFQRAEKDFKLDNFETVWNKMTPAEKETTIRKIIKKPPKGVSPSIWQNTVLQALGGSFKKGATWSASKVVHLYGAGIGLCLMYDYLANLWRDKKMTNAEIIKDSLLWFNNLVPSGGDSGGGGKNDDEGALN